MFEKVREIILHQYVGTPISRPPALVKHPPNVDPATPIHRRKYLEQHDRDLRGVTSFLTAEQI